MLAGAVFGFLDAMQLRLQGIKFPYIGEVPVQAIQVLPYILTVILLAGFIGRAVAPTVARIDRGASAVKGSRSEGDGARIII